jgi:hypothetical protein
LSSPDSNRAAEFPKKSAASNPTRIIQVGSAFWSRNARGRMHPHFVLSPMSHASGKVIVANCTSVKVDDATGQPLPNQDYTCRLQPGVHEWIKLDSIIYYKDAQLWTPDDVTIEARPGTENVSENFVSRELLQSMQHGIVLSTRTPEEVRRFMLSFAKK